MNSEQRVTILETRLEKLTAMLEMGGGIAGATGYYVALITQSSTSDPTIDEIVNTTASTVTAARIGAGTYTLTFSVDIFLSNYAHITVGGIGVHDQICNARLTGISPSVVTVYTGDMGGAAIDDVLDNATIMIVLFEG